MRSALSVVLPVHNEQAILAENVLTIERHLSRSPVIGPFEILLVCNGCTDDSERIAQELAALEPDTIRSLTIPTRGLGHAIREGIRAATYNTVMFYAVDLPFGLAILDRSVEAAGADPHAIVIGSKGHPRSRIDRSAARQLFSRTIAVANNLLFGLHVRDTQGSLLFPKAILERYHAALDSDGPFFQAQLVIYGHRMGYNVVELPVRLVREAAARKTRLKLARDGMAYLADLVREKRKMIRENRRR